MLLFSDLVYDKSIADLPSPQFERHSPIGSTYQLINPSMQRIFLRLFPPFFENIFFIYGILFLGWSPFLIMVAYIIEGLFFPFADYLYIFFAKCTYKYEFFINRSKKYKRMSYIFYIFILGFLLSTASSNPLIIQFFDINNQAMLYSAVTSMIFVIGLRMIADVYIRLQENKNLPLQRCAQIKFSDRKLYIVYGVIFAFSLGLLFIRSPIEFTVLVVMVRIFFEFFDFNKKKFIFSP